MVLLGTFALAWTVVAWLAWPIWDDGWLLFTAEKLGPTGVERALGDRPVVGVLWGAMLRAGTLRQTSALAHLLTWLGMGTVSMAVWRRAYPQLSSFGVIAGILAIAPMFTTTQPVLVNAVWTTELPALLAWIALVWLWPELSGEGHGSLAFGIPKLLIGSALLMAGCLLAEYGVASGLAGGVALAGIASRRNGEGKRGPWIRGAMVVALTLIAFVLFRSNVDAGVREGVGPKAFMSHAVARIISFPVFMASSLWQAELGAVLSRVGSVRVELSGMERVSTFAALVSMASAIVTVWWCRRVSGIDAEPPAPATGRQFLASLVNRNRTHLALVLGIAAGLSPFCLMARVPLDGTSTRYWVPVLPLLTTLPLWLILSAARSARMRSGLIGLLVGTAVFVSIVDGVRFVRDRQFVRGLAKQLAPFIATGPTLVVLADSEPWPAYTRDYDLTERARQDMPSGTSRRFWITRELPEPQTGLTLVPGSADRTVAPQLDVEWFRFKGAEHASLERIVWASLGKDRRLHAILDDYPAVAARP